MTSVNVPVVFRVKAEDQAKAEEYVARLVRYGFQELMEFEQETVKAIKHWSFAEIRPRKKK